ncbi:hypothetical protein ACO1O0_008864 [Amphichorda felina]
MVSWEWDPNYVPPVKLGLHCAQILLSFVLWCLELAVFNGKDSKIVGTNGWTFGVCFLSIPAWVYLIMTPRFARTRRYANANVMLAVDLLFTIIWISAFATQADYNTQNLCGKVCKLSKAVVGLGVFVALLFALTTLISGYTMQYYKFHGNLPGYDNRKIRGGENIDPDKAAFSMAPHDDEAYERVNMDDNDAFAGDQYGHANPYSADDFGDPNRYGGQPSRTNDMFDADTEYSSAIGTAPTSYGGAGAGAPSRTYDDPAQFPAANYDRIER